MPSTSDSPATKGNTLLQRMMNSDIPKTHFFRLLTIPHIAQPDLSSAITSQAEEDAFQMYPKVFAKEDSQDPPNPLASPVWRPSGAWKWISGMGIRACKNVVTLSCDQNSSLYFGTATIASEIKTESIQFLCKSWPLHATMKEFITEMTLHKRQLLPLAGTYAPTVIGVFTGTGLVNMLMELPHQAFWLQASTDMPDVLKKRCVEAYEKLHAAGILHGSPHLRHLLIGGDARVTIVNFERSRVVDPIINTHIAQAKADATDLRLEMRRIKYQLDFENGREKEKQKWERYKARLEHSKREYLCEPTDPTPYAPQILEILEEDILDPPIDPRRLRSWAPERNYSSTRFVVPTITPEAFANAVEKFIANIRRLEREGDGPPPSRSPSPNPPGIQPVNDQPLLDQAPTPSIPERSPAARRSSRKRKSPADDAEGPHSSKRPKTIVTRPPPGVKPASRMKRVALEPITVERFIASPTTPTSDNHDPAIPSGVQSQVDPADFLSDEPGPSSLRSALKSAAQPVFFAPLLSHDDEMQHLPVNRGKRKRKEADDHLELEVETSPSKKARSTSPAKEEKHVSFAPAPDVFLKNWTIPPHLLTKPQKRRHRRFMRWRSSSTHLDASPTSSYGMRACGAAEQSSWLESNFTFTFPPPLGFRFISRWLKDMVHHFQS